jgi:FixJ family two-component response regulator
LGDPKTISVIDDDPSIRSSTEGLLRSYSYHVRLFNSADEFLASADLQDCDCIVSDVQMPGKSGYDLLAELARLRLPIPVVLITAYFDKAAAAKAKTAGAACILPKPFQASDLIDCIENAIGA